uniref:Uncharacterized protein n=1 Tax=Pristionchus pacificus TaxID=54126 RepID=A0A2A6CEW4_PRIPA
MEDRRKEGKVESEKGRWRKSTVVRLACCMYVAAFTPCTVLKEMSMLRRVPLSENLRIGTKAAGWNETYDIAHPCIASTPSTLRGCQCRKRGGRD